MGLLQMPTPINSVQQSYKIHKPSGNGTTHKIREQLNFTDDKKWKQFSSRRLELIDKFGLSHRKASEQDDNIRQIATILRTEFNYPLSSAGEFEKLVTAAVQSVRRNRKRSKKRYNNLLDPQQQHQTRFRSHLPTNLMGDYTSDEDSISRTASPLSSILNDTTNAIPPSNLQQSLSNTLPNIRRMASPHEMDDIALSMVQPHLQSNLLNQQQKLNNNQNSFPQQQLSPQNFFQQQQQALSTSSTIQGNNNNITTTTSQKYDEILKAIIYDIVNNIVPLSEQSINDENKNGLNLTDFALSTNNSQLLSINNNNNNNSMDNSRSSSPNQNLQNIPFFLKEKLLLNIQKSRTCLELSSQSSFDLYSNLESLGSTSIKSAIHFVLERFFSNLNASSMNYVFFKVSSTEGLANISNQLFSQATKRDLNQLPDEFVKLRLLNLLVGALIKDYGFECIYPFSEILHQVITRQYPLVLSNNNDISNSNSNINPNTNMSSNNMIGPSTILSTLPMKPQLASQALGKRVIIQFREQQQQFVFPLLSNGAPTVSEVIDNCRSLFKISEELKSNLFLFHNNLPIHKDFELASLFNNFSRDELLLELRELNEKPRELPQPQQNFQPMADSTENSSMNGLPATPFLPSRATTPYPSILSPPLHNISRSTTPSFATLLNGTNSTTVAPIARKPQIITTPPLDRPSSSFSNQPSTTNNSISLTQQNDDNKDEEEIENHNKINISNDEIKKEDKDEGEEEDMDEVNKNNKKEVDGLKMLSTISSLINEDEVPTATTTHDEEKGEDTQPKTLLTAPVPSRPITPPVIGNGEDKEKIPSIEAKNELRQPLL